MSPLDAFKHAVSELIRDEKLPRVGNDLAAIIDSMAVVLEHHPISAEMLWDAEFVHDMLCNLGQDTSPESVLAAVETTVTEQLVLSA